MLARVGFHIGNYHVFAVGAFAGGLAARSRGEAGAVIFEAVGLGAEAYFADSCRFPLLSRSSLLVLSVLALRACTAGSTGHAQTEALAVILGAV